MKGKLFKTGISMLLASAMMITSIPATNLSAAEPKAGETPVLDSAIVTYDFNDWSVVTGDDGKLTNGTDKKIVLETVGNGKKPELKNTARGKVLAMTEQDYANRGAALLPENPFAGKSVDNGFTLSFWTKTTGSVGGNRCLVDFEVAPAKDPAATSDPDRAGTFAVNQSMVYWNTTSQNSKFTDFNISNMSLAPANGWKMVTMAVTKEGITFYSDGKKIQHTVQANDAGGEDYEQMIKDLAGTSGICDDPAKTKVRLGASMATYWHCAGAWIDDVSFFGKALSDAEVTALYNETLVDTSSVVVNAVEIQGPNSVTEESRIQLSAVLLPEDASDISGKKVTWESDNTEVLTVDSRGRATGVSAGTANVTAKVNGTEITSKPFPIKVTGLTQSLTEGKYYLTVYSTTKDFYASTDNLAQETRSVYFAVSADGRKFEVLNNGGGVIFAKKGSKQLTDPRVYKDNGKFKVMAADNTTSNGIHLFTSEDGVNYYDESLTEDYAEGDGPLKKANFELLLKGENILTTDTSISLGNAVELTEAEYKHFLDKLGTVKNTGLEKTELEEVNVEAGSDIAAALKEQRPSVNATYSDGSTQKFNIDWSEAAKNVDNSKVGESYILTGKVAQTKYLNNLKAINGSTLPEDDPANVNANEPDNYNEETGKVYFDKTKYVEGMADPMIYWDEQTGYYYMTGSYFPEAKDKDKLPGDNTQQYDRVVLRRGKTLEELQDRSKQVTIWKVGNQGYENGAGTNVASGYRYIWAPEIHRVGNNWVVYFTESHGSNNAYDIYCHALILDGTKDPYETALKAADGVSEWKDYQMRGGTGKTKAITSSFCLDMTYFKDAVNNESYVIWASKAYGNSELYLAKVSEDQPWKLTSDIVLLTTPEYGWENVRYMVNEGPTVLQKDGNIFMCYSASGTGSEYAIGMMNAKAGTDLLKIDNWTKSPYPLLTSRDVDGEEGPGHNSFTVDQDGNAIFVYHARPTSHNDKHCGWNGTESTHYNDNPLNDPCRHARLKRVHWAADGTPILKMTYEDELLEANQNVTVKVTITEKTTTSVTDIKLSKSSLNLTVGQSDTLTATVLPNDATNKDVIWKSSDDTIASVENGKVTAKKAGKATITVTSADNETIKKTCEVTVTANVPVKDITLSKTNLTLAPGKSETLNVTFNPSNATNKGLTWKTSNDKVATVVNGKVTAKKAGKATITVTTKDGGFKKTCNVTVKIPVKSVSLDKTKLTLGAKEKFTLKATVKPSNATNKTVTWKTSNKKVATVSKGKVTTKKAGKVTITAKADGKSKKCVITVKKAPNKITLNAKKKTLKKGKKFQIKAKLPKNTASYKITYKSSNKKVATVSASGKVTAKKKGKAIITVTTFNKKKATLKITVK